MAQSNDRAQDVPESPEQARKRFVVPSFAYVAHYTPFVTRKQHIIRMLEHEKIRPVFIESFDREVLTDADTMRFCLTRLKLGHVSLTCKHVEVWRRIANDPENDFGIVFEDDVIVTFLFVETLQTYLDQLPHDFDLFMINSGCNLRIPKD
jgi:GR25 family glycosyltransferase involved in LPS biosynthesis